MVVVGEAASRVGAHVEGRSEGRSEEDERQRGKRSREVLGGVR